MGKKGDLLRQKKKQDSAYTITGKWLEEHDEQIRKEVRENILASVKIEMAEYFDKREHHVQEQITQEWDRREKKFKSEDNEENFFNMLQYTLAVPVRVLIEQFGWKPITTRIDERMNIIRFIKAVEKEIDNIAHDQLMSIEMYSQETEKMYGVTFFHGDEPEMESEGAGGQEKPE